MLVVTFVLGKRCTHANRHVITFADTGRGCMQHIFDAGEEHGEQCPDNVRLHGEGATCPRLGHLIPHLFNSERAACCQCFPHYAAAAARLDL